MNRAAVVATVAILAIWRAWQVRSSPIPASMNPARTVTTLPNAVNYPTTAFLLTELI